MSSAVTYFSNLGKYIWNCKSYHLSFSIVFDLVDLLEVVCCKTNTIHWFCKTLFPTDQLNPYFLICNVLLKCHGMFMLVSRTRTTCQNIKENNILWWLLEGRTKGQLISKYLFGVFNSPKTRTKTIRFEVVVKSIFFRFLGRIEDTKKTLRN